MPTKETTWDGMPMIPIASMIIDRFWLLASVPKEIFRDRERTFTEKLKLENCSGLLMTAGMQDTHDHRIPKSGFKCGPRISFTFRGLAK